MGWLTHFALGGKFTAIYFDLATRQCSLVVIIRYVTIFDHVRWGYVDCVENCPKRTRRCVNNAVDRTKLAYLDMFLVHRVPKLNAQRVRRESADNSLYILQLTAGRILSLLEKRKPTGAYLYTHTHTTLRER